MYFYLKIQKVVSDRIYFLPKRTKKKKRKIKRRTKRKNVLDRGIINISPRIEVDQGAIDPEKAQKVKRKIKKKMSILNYQNSFSIMPPG